jgi:hypothetical protein
MRLKMGYIEIWFRYSKSILKQDVRVRRTDLEEETI